MSSERMLSMLGLQSMIIEMSPTWVNLFALLNKFMRTWLNFVGSRYIHLGTLGSMFRSREFPLFYKFERLDWTTLQTCFRSCTGRSTISNCSAWILPASKMLLIWLIKNSPEVTARMISSFWSESKSADCYRIYMEPRVEFKGFLISWFIDEINLF